MRLSRLRSGELIALVGAVGLAVLMFLPWYTAPGGGGQSAWQEFGAVDVLAAFAILAGLALAATTVTEHSTALPVASAVWTTLFGLISTLAVLVGLLSRPDHTTAVQVCGWLGLIASLAILVGAWQSMRDERTDRYPPVDPPLRSLAQ
jgi:hypothetical protein